ncbi:esterase-like activity of phytase family protein [Myxosarcina sp. GI1]|uniref:esterase-like activity of phytase family protein n=1 Tax=Myxosarcina sp. GI1 TaxID=1541065 RepID=UPI000ADF3679|nr:esterase-like activity of phytase family protein [Myxosarcina sp. GI1]
MANELIGFASLPADTFAEGPQSGADDGEGNPIEANGRTGPFDGQPVQGFSGVQFAPDNSGALWFLSDNGFGAQENSTDYLLRIYQADPDFAGAEKGDGSVEVQNFVQLSDPDKLIPFNIVNENSEERLLTGSDFDIESFVFDSNGDIWVGDEFGPYLLHFDRGGTLIEAPIPTPNIPRLNTLNGQDPLVIGHRGASGLLPEHTLEAYRVAIAQGADFIEPDLVSTKDGVLIARHEPILDDTTNVAEVFGEDRMSTKILDGEEVTAYFAEDFTLAEIKQLRAVQQNDFRSQEFNGAFEIPTFQEVIELVQEVEAQTGVQVGIYPETKHPTYFDLQDLSPEESLIETLQKTGFTNPNRIFIQSFEFENLIKLQGMLDEAGLGDIPLVQLYGDTTKDASPEDGFSVPYDIRYNLEQGNDLKAIYGQEFLAAVENGLSEATTYRDMDSAEFLQVIADLYAEGAGPWKNNILLRESLEEPVDGNDDGEAEITTQLTGEITSFIDDAHTAGLQVHPYTLRNEEQFLTLEADGTPQTPEREFEQLIQIGADGFFTDFPGTGDKVRDAVVADLVKSPQNPALGEEQLANLNRSQGFEGMAFSPDNTTLYPLLEGPVLGDPDNALRIYKFDPERSEYSDELIGYYPTEDSHPIGDFTPINENEFLVIERDNNEGEEAEFKKIFKIDISKVDENGFVAKEEVVDLLNIADPNDLNEDGKTSFSFPFVTIEDVVVVDEDTILVANDNNYPFSMGREGDIDNNEVILLDLEQPLDLDPTLGGSPLTDTLTPDTESKTTFAQVDSGTTSVFLDLPLLKSAAGITLVDTDSTEEPFSEDFQVGFPIEDSYFTFETDPFVPVSGSIKHSGTVTLGLDDTEVTVGDFSIGFDETRVSETASGFFVADTTEDDLELEILFDVGTPGSLNADAESLEIAEADLLVAPEFAEALGAAELTGADVGDTRVDASAIEPEITVGETTALIPQAGSSYAPEDLQEGSSGDTDFPYGDFKALATVGEIDPDNGHVLTGYPDGQAAWLADQDTVRVAYQSESYATLSSETYPWEMESGATFTGSHVHTIDYDREAFAEFLNNDAAASEMFKGAGHLFDTVYNVFGEIVDGKNLDSTDLSAKWGNQTLPDGTVVEFDSDRQLTLADWFFHSFCGAYYEQANKYGDGIGFEDDVWLMGEEWNIGEMFEEAAAAAGITEEEARISPGEDYFTQTMGLASMVVDIENETAYTVPVLGQSGYEKMIPMNSGHEDYVVMVMAGYNLEVEPAPLTVYVGKKGVDAHGNPLAEGASDRDSFLGRNGLLYGQIYGMAATDETYASLGIDEVDADEFMLDAYATDADAPENFSARYVPTSYQWDGFDTPEAAADTEVFLWEKDGDNGEVNEQPEGHTYFNGDSKTEHPAVDPDITKHRYVQNLTVPSAQLGIDFTDMVNELENNDADGNGLPDYLSADVTRILAGVDGALTLETGGKGKGHIGPNNPDGTLTHATHLEIEEARLDQPDGLQWIKTSDGDYLIVDEDSGNDYGERKMILPIDAETLQLEEERTGYFLASAGGELNPRAIAEISAIPDTFTEATSSEFSGSWNVTHLVQTKEDGSFYTQEEIAGTGIQDIIDRFPLNEQTLIGVVQHSGESSGIIEEREADQGGQIFQFNVADNLALI